MRECLYFSTVPRNYDLCTLYVRGTTLDAIAAANSPVAVSQFLRPSLHLSHTPHLDSRRHNELAGLAVRMCRSEEQGLREWQ